MIEKICTCKPDEAWYNDFGVIKCQYCMGRITDKERLRKIEEYNTPVPEKKILDVCCGGRMFWFDKQHSSTLYVDRREVDPVTVGLGKNARMFSCQPDKVMDFRNLDLPDGQFNLVVFDPPHFVRAGDSSYMVKKYGKLDPQNWEEDLRLGFAECFRVLKEDGFLIFKWNEYQIPLSKILNLTTVKPLFGHVSGKQQKTHWVMFMKSGSEIISYLERKAEEV